MIQNKLFVKDKETLRFFPLEKLGNCLSFHMHNNGQKVKFWNQYDYVPCGTKLDTAIIGITKKCPFCNHPDKEIRSTKEIRFMVVNTISNSNITFNNKVCYFDLKLSIYNQMNNYEIMSSKSIYLKPIAINRKGSGPYDTEYQVAVSEFNIQNEITPDGYEMINILRKEISDHYLNIVNNLKDVFKSALMNGQAQGSDRIITDGTEF